MKNLVQKGVIITVTAPAAVSSGDGVLVGSIFGVATMDAASGADIDIQVEGVFDLPKAGSQAWTVGALIYWDNNNKRCTTDDGMGSNKLIGVAVAAVGNGADETTGRVRLNGAFVG